MMYIGDYLARRELYSPDKLAFVDYGREPVLRLTYAMANERANRLANFFSERGVGFRDRVAILGHDCVEHLDTFFACSKLGAIHTAMNYRLHWRETLEILDLTTPKALVYTDDFKEDVVQIQQALRGKRHEIKTYIHIDGLGIKGSLDFGTILQASSPKSVSRRTVEKEDTAALIFTGGTTGLPKAAQVSHRMIAWNTINTFIHDLRHDDIYLNVFPLFHTGGLFVYTLPQVIFGGTTIFISQFKPELVLDLIEQEKVTVFAGVPTMYQMLTQADNWAQADLSTLRFCTSGGAPLPVPLVEQYTREKRIRFKQGFGMTEFGPGIFALAPEDAIRKAGSIGRPNFYVEAAIMDDGKNFLGPYEVGELVLRGPSYCSGYYNDVEATAQALDEMGFFHTGDLSKFDDEGYFYIVDRKKDMFISGGENVYPVEIEKVLYQHPAVHMCAVVGVPNPKWGEIGVACVVLKPQTNVSEDELLDFLNARLARYKIPKRVVFMPELPISGAGKILKRDLKEQLSKE
jgi:fatty-acyl-CoA synthase